MLRELKVQVKGSIAWVCHTQGMRDTCSLAINPRNPHRSPYFCPPEEFHT
jgi:hypothetical protein